MVQTHRPRGSRKRSRGSRTRGAHVYPPAYKAGVTSPEARDGKGNAPIPTLSEALADPAGLAHLLGEEGAQHDL
jgi:hypothetical protein